MKISRLLVLSALWLVGLGANAADLIERVEPTMEDIVETPVAFEVGKTYILYNKTAAMFFTQGSTWSTRGCVVPNKTSAVMVRVGKYTLADAEWDGKTYEINNYVTNRSSYSWYKACMNDAGDLYLDQLTWGDRFYEIVSQGDNVYRLKPSELNPTIKSDGTKFVGYGGLEYDGSNDSAGFEDADQRVPLQALLTVEEGHHVDWVFYSYEAYDVYEKAMDLKALIEAAEAEGIDVSAAVAVYNNASATYDQLVKAFDDLTELRSNNIANGTADKPTDATSFIVNPKYEGNSREGWTIAYPDGGSNYDVRENIAECFGINFYYYQDLKDILNGVYELRNQSFYRAGSTSESYTSWQNGTNKNLKMYAKMGEDSVSVAVANIFEGAVEDQLGFGSEVSAGSPLLYVPNDMTAAAGYFNDEYEVDGVKTVGHYPNSLFFGTDDNTARIGMAKAVNIANNWSIWGKWELKYYGNSPEAFALWVKKAGKEIVIPDGTVYSQPYLDAYNTAAGAAATNKAEALAAIAAIEAAAAALDENIALWKEFAEVLAEAKAVISDTSLERKYRDYVDDWELDYGDMNKPTKRDKYTNEQIAAAIEKGKELIAEAKKHPAVPGTDMTSLLTNPDFEQGEKGWTGFKSALQVKWGGSKTMPTTGGTTSNTCAEAFSTQEFDLYQVVEGAPVGVYEIEVQGFCRNGRGDTAWSNYENQTYYSQSGKFPVWVYLNANTTPFVNVFSEPVDEGYYKSVDSGAEVYVHDGQEYPDGMKSSAVAFADGMYKQKAYGLIAQYGDEMRIGVKGHSAGLDGEDDNWVIFDNFKLTWVGFDADVIKPVLEARITSDEELLKEVMGKTAHSKLEAAIKAAKASLEGTDGEAMFNCLSALFELGSEVNASIELFSTLTKALDVLMDEIDNAENATAAAEATELYTTITQRMGKYEIEDSEVEGLIDEINAAITKMKISGYEDASDLNPVDMTNVIINPSYSENIDGWNGTAPDQWGGTDQPSAQHYNTDYDMYQTFLGLPAGTYKVAVQGFYRAGYANNDYAKKDSVEYSHAFLYAQTKDDEGNDIVSSKALHRLNEILNMEGYEYAEVDAVETNYTPAYTDTIKVEGEADTYKYHLVPNMISTAYSYLGTGFFNNVVTVKVAEGAPLRIGLKKNQKIDGDWTYFDEWTLFYYGTESAYTPDGDPSGIKDMNLGDTCKSEFYTLDGRKATAAQKGIIIQKTTFSNGAVVVRKIRR